MRALLPLAAVSLLGFALSGCVAVEVVGAGVGVAGVVGAVSLVLSCYGFGALPVRNWALAPATFPRGSTSERAPCGRVPDGGPSVSFALVVARLEPRTRRRPS